MAPPPCFLGEELADKFFILTIVDALPSNALKLGNSSSPLDSSSEDSNFCALLRLRFLSTCDWLTGDTEQSTDSDFLPSPKTNDFSATTQQLVSSLSTLPNNPSGVSE
ncbi:hypothetical protein GDO78_004477 [Eleutherodactylus coqui]|uniref:Uncharacterized protein n=1 Tax=Eleutherodactylus coqui TaxID=57060 RepID=A0A8J6ESS9_ELECQ|nr:hypothetical protein GDO78_004477 [Eleutherodactylus coqui]